LAVLRQFHHESGGTKLPRADPDAIRWISGPVCLPVTQDCRKIFGDRIGYCMA
jgi:hypothetical protein